MLILLICVGAGRPEFGKTCLYDTCTLPIPFWKTKLQQRGMFYELCASIGCGVMVIRDILPHHLEKTVYCHFQRTHEDVPLKMTFKEHPRMSPLDQSEAEYFHKTQYFLA